MNKRKVIRGIMFGVGMGLGYWFLDWVFGGHHDYVSVGVIAGTAYWLGLIDGAPEEKDEDG